MTIHYIHHWYSLGFISHTSLKLYRLDVIEVNNIGVDKCNRTSHTWWSISIFLCTFDKINIFDSWKFIWMNQYVKIKGVSHIDALPPTLRVYFSCQVIIKFLSWWYHCITTVLVLSLPISLDFILSSLTILILTSRFHWHWSGSFPSHFQLISSVIDTSDDIRLAFNNNTRQGISYKDIQINQIS